jgi:hypothetical protein
MVKPNIISEDERLVFQDINGERYDLKLKNITIEGTKENPEIVTRYECKPRSEGEKPQTKNKERSKPF